MEKESVKLNLVNCTVIMIAIAAILVFIIYCFLPLQEEGEENNWFCTSNECQELEEELAQLELLPQSGSNEERVHRPGAMRCNNPELAYTTLNGLSYGEVEDCYLTYGLHGQELTDDEKLQMKEVLQQEEEVFRMGLCPTHNPFDLKKAKRKLNKLHKQVLYNYMFRNTFM